MIASIPGKTGRQLCTRVAGRRFRKLSTLQSATGRCSDGKSTTSSSLSTFVELRTTTISRSFSSSVFVPAEEKSGLEHHSMFQEQMLDLEKEQRQFGLSQDDDSNPMDSTMATPTMPISNDLEEQLSDWKSEQTQVFGETLADHDPSNPSNDNTDLDAREDRFEFTAEDFEAWGKPNPEASDMKKILEQVALERAKEDAYAKSASLSPQANNNVSGSPSGDDHHESFSHVSGDGSSVHMVDVGHKAVTTRTAHARSEVWLPPDVLEAFLQTDGEELVGPKGPIFATAKIAGIMACKKTSDLIPLCHPLPLDQVKLDISMKEEKGDEANSGGTVVIDCTCKVTHKTGVEMEALTGATVAALTIYDMTKAVSHNIRIQETRLIAKKGGKRTVLDGAENTTPER